MLNHALSCVSTYLAYYYTCFLSPRISRFTRIIILAFFLHVSRGSHVLLYLLLVSTYLSYHTYYLYLILVSTYLSYYFYDCFLSPRISRIARIIMLDSCLHVSRVSHVLLFLLLVSTYLAYRTNYIHAFCLHVSRLSHELLFLPLVSTYLSCIFILASCLHVSLVSHVL